MQGHPKDTHGRHINQCKRHINQRNRSKKDCKTDWLWSLAELVEMPPGSNGWLESNHSQLCSVGMETVGSFYQPSLLPLLIPSWLWQHWSIVSNAQKYLFWQQYHSIRMYFRCLFNKASPGIMCLHKRTFLSQFIHKRVCIYAQRERVNLGQM